MTGGGAVPTPDSKSYQIKTYMSGIGCNFFELLTSGVL